MDWGPFCSRIEFETAEFLYKKDQMPVGNINELLELWAASTAALGGSPPFNSAREMHHKIDEATLGDVAWESFRLCFRGDRDGPEQPEWMDAEYTVWHRDPHKVARNLLSNADFMNEVDLVPFHSYDAAGCRQYHNFMSGDWSWKQAVRISHFLFLCLFTYHMIRIFLQPMLTTMAPFLSQSFLAVTRRLSQL
jgi:hypothetical protein